MAKNADRDLNLDNKVKRGRGKGVGRPKIKLAVQHDLQAQKLEFARNINSEFQLGYPVYITPRERDIFRCKAFRALFFLEKLLGHETSAQIFEKRQKRKRQKPRAKFRAFLIKILTWRSRRSMKIQGTPSGVPESSQVHKALKPHNKLYV